MADTIDSGGQLEQLNPIQSSNNPLSRKFNKVLETRLDNDKDMLEALKSLSVFFVENNLRSRRNLRGDIERRSLVINEEFVECFQGVKQQLDSIYNDVKSMNDCCQDMTQRLKAAKEQTRDLINQTTQLQTESQTLQMRAQVADAFLDKFQLKREEVMVLRGTQHGTLHPDFFKALTRVKQIHNDCKVLLRTNQQTAGLEIMESMALHQESAYERLYRSTQNECRTLTGETLEVSEQLMDGMQALQDRPVLFRYSLDEFGTARRAAIVRGFIDALTRGGAGGTPRPIELHSHDPLRYIGDMLAWLHQSIASEKEYLQALLKKCKPKGSEDQIIDVLGHTTEGVCRPLKVRVEQVLVSEPGSVTLFKLANLLKFYLTTINQVITGDWPLISTLDDMHTLCLRIFYNSLNYHASKLLDKVELPPPDLGPTAAFNSTIQLLQEIFSSQNSSVVPLDARKHDLTQILSCLVDPVLQMCLVSASNLNSVDMATYMINCIYLLQTTLAVYEFVDHTLEMLQAQIDAHLDTLVSEQASFILNQAGLSQMYALVQQHKPDQGALSSMPGANSNSIKSAMNQFDQFLATPDTLVLAQCSLLLSAKLREAVKKHCVELICHAYTQMYNAITTPANNYPQPLAIVPRTPEQVHKLLS